MALTFPLFLLESNKVCVLVGLDLGKGAILLLSLLNFAFPFMRFYGWEDSDLLL
jgi:hypothetical protein